MVTWMARSPMEYTFPVRTGAAVICRLRNHVIESVCLYIYIYVYTTDVGNDFQFRGWSG